MAHFCAALLFVCLLASVARAAEPRSLRVTSTGDLPFSQADLKMALKLRIPLVKFAKDGLLPVAEVRAMPGGRAVITVGDARRSVSLAGLTGPDAARIVALLILDLASTIQSADDAEQAKPAPPAPPSDRVTVAISPRLSLGARQWAAAFEPNLDLAVKVSRLFLLHVEAGFTWTVAGDGAAKLTLLEVPVRAGAGLRYRWFEARVGLALRPYWVSGAGEDSGALVGATVGLYFRRLFSRWLVAYAAVGVDLFSRRKTFRVDGDTVMTTGHAVPWLGLGAGWQGG